MYGMRRAWLFGNLQCSSSKTQLELGPFSTAVAPQALRIAQFRPNLSGNRTAEKQRFSVPFALRRPVTSKC
jgi:hypothetical protein